jgi:hypothetical protein
VKRSGLAALVSVVAFAAVVVWASKQDTPKFPEDAAHWALLVGAIGLYAVATLVRGWRWHTILRHAGVRHRAADAYALVPVGYMGNTVLPRAAASCCASSSSQAGRTRGAARCSARSSPSACSTRSRSRCSSSR